MTDMDALAREFDCPPHSAKPGVYWYVMDGTLNRAGITKDLEAMAAAGIGSALFLEVNLDQESDAPVPRGSVDFLSPEWLDLVAHAVAESERLGIDLILASGPGWAGSGGPWVTPEQSMRHLVSATVEVSGDGCEQSLALPVPPPRRPFFADSLPDDAVRRREAWYDDVAVLAFPGGASHFGGEPVATLGRRGQWGAYWDFPAIDGRAFYYRQPISTASETERQFPTSSLYVTGKDDVAVDPATIVDLTGRLAPDGTLTWTVPDGEWTVMRLGMRNTGAGSRPAPIPGWGFEADKLSADAMAAHLDAYLGPIFARLGFDQARTAPGGIKGLHIDSWEMGAQNWTDGFQAEFTTRRGYDPQPYLPCYAGVLVGDRETSERFLWDVRLTVQELIVANHIGFTKAFAHRHGLPLSLEPYDMTPAADLELALAADLPMCEFWGRGFGPDTIYSVAETTSAAHLLGQPVVPAESFTSHLDGWRQYPGSVKGQTDWAFAAGVNKLMFHTFCHQPLPDGVRPGMTFGPYGSHWDRNQTWWPLSDAYHRYVARCSLLLRQGRPVADILYLTPEGAPQVFYPPASAYVVADSGLPDRRGHNVDACPPGWLSQARVDHGEIVFPGGVRYRVLVLPQLATMTPGLLRVVRDLVAAGATVLGQPPRQSASLADQGAGDAAVRQLADELWGSGPTPATLTVRPFGDGRIAWGGSVADGELYPAYELSADLVGLPEDFASDGPIRYTHRVLDDGRDLYFVANRTAAPAAADCCFRVGGRAATLWHPVTGERYALPEARLAPDGRPVLHLGFAPNESYFVLFEPGRSVDRPLPGDPCQVMELTGPWEVQFDPAWGGPDRPVRFDVLSDWTTNADDGIRHYSGAAIYRETFDLPQGVGQGGQGRLWLDLGAVGALAKVTLNGQELGVVWTAPWRVDITTAARTSGNQLEIEVVNLWINRIIGDQRLPEDGIHDGRWPEWLTGDVPRTSGRYTYATALHHQAGDPLVPSGLFGPVTLWVN